MNQQNETTKNSSTTEKPSTFRIALLSAVALTLLGRTLLTSGEVEASGERQTYATAQSVIVEVQATLQKTPCRFADKTIAEARSRELPALIPAWQQTARVEPSELLRSLQRIAEVTNCPKGKSTASGALENMKQSLEGQLAQDVRSHFARLRRAQREGDKKAAYRHVTELRELLTHHRGPYTQHLERLERMYKEP